MPNASARGVKRYIRLKNSGIAKEFQKIQAEDWLKENLKSISMNDG